VPKRQFFAIRWQWENEKASAAGLMVKHLAAAVGLARHIYLSDELKETSAPGR